MFRLELGVYTARYHGVYHCPLLQFGPINKCIFITNNIALTNFFIALT
jgi:hypothetical protein